MGEDNPELSVEIGSQVRDPSELIELLEEDPSIVTLGDVLDSGFMSSNTKFITFDEFVEEMPDILDFEGDLNNMPVMARLTFDEQEEQQALDNYVSNTTEFESWEELQTEAQNRMLALWTSGQLDPA